MRRDGSPLVLRLHRPWYHDIAALRSEHLWTRALVQAGIAAPEPLLTQAGENFAQVEIAATGERRWAGLARWVEGELLADVVARETDSAANARHFAHIGSIMAAMHDQATSWTPPAGFQRHALDADGLMGPEPFWGPFWDHPIFSPVERDMLLGARDRLHAALTRYGKPARTFSLIHADLHPRNVLIDGALRCGYRLRRCRVWLAPVRPRGSADRLPGPSRLRHVPRRLYRGLSVSARDLGRGPRAAADVPADPRHGADRLVPSASGIAASGRCLPRLKAAHLLQGGGLRAADLRQENSRIKVANSDAVGGSTVVYTADYPHFHPSDFRVHKLDGAADRWEIDYATIEPFVKSGDATSEWHATTSPYGPRLRHAFAAASVSKKYLKIADFSLLFVNMENQREIALMHVVAVGEPVGEMTEHNDGVALHHKLIPTASRCLRVLGAYDRCCLLSRWHQNAVVVVTRRMLPALLQIPPRSARARHACRDTARRPASGPHRCGTRNYRSVILAGLYGRRADNARAD